MKRAVILGISGQDGSYLAELLVSKGYEVHGIVRRHAVEPYPNIEHLDGKVTLHYGDMATENRLCVLMHELQPDEVYNLAGQSHVAVSFEDPEYTTDVVGLGVIRLLEAVRCFAPQARVYQASSSEMFGSARAPQNEDTPMMPRSPYGAAKLCAYHDMRVYRDAHKVFACNGILFNHESERRGQAFVTRKITRAVGRIVYGSQESISLGNLDAKRDWGYAPDYVEAMWLMLQQDKPDDYVVGTGETHTVREFCELAFLQVGLYYLDYVQVDPKLYRPAEVHCLRADATKARTVLGWQPRTTFSELVAKMVDHDIQLARNEKGG